MGIFSDWRSALKATLLSMGVAFTTPAEASLNKIAALPSTAEQPAPLALAVKQANKDVCLFLPTDKNNPLQSVMYTTGVIKIGKKFRSQPGDILAVFKDFEGMIAVRNYQKIVVLATPQIFFDTTNGPLLDLKSKERAIASACIQEQLMPNLNFIEPKPKPVRVKLKNLFARVVDKVL